LGACSSTLRTANAGEHGDEHPLISGDVHAARPSTVPEQLRVGGVRVAPNVGGSGRSREARPEIQILDLSLDCFPAERGLGAGPVEPPRKSAEFVRTTHAERDPYGQTWTTVPGWSREADCGLGLRARVSGAAGTWARPQVDPRSTPRRAQFDPRSDPNEDGPDVAADRSRERDPRDETARGSQGSALPRPRRARSGRRTRGSHPGTPWPARRARPPRNQRPALRHVTCFPDRHEGQGRPDLATASWRRSTPGHRRAFERSSPAGV
jgi:hypothetical protein